MTLGEKLSKLRKENNYTQENLADILGVSRQSISKWESDIAYPETDKLIQLSDLYNCSLDYLLKDDQTRNEQQENTWHLFGKKFREKKSEKTIWGMPLWHIAKNAKGFVAVGLNARGFIAIGLNAQGIISLGLLSIGILSFGLLSLGLLALGVFALGLMAIGCIAAGIFALGAISFGVISMGAISIGNFSFGALAIGQYVARGDHAYAMIALGNTKAIGSTFQKVGELTLNEIDFVKQTLDSIVPGYLSWAKEIIKLFL